MRSSTLLALAASLSSAAAVFQGFNYGSTNTDGSAKNQQQYEAEFKAAQTLVGASGFSSARLYTMVQAGTANTPISAIDAAISTKTSLLLGMWASAGQESFNNELAALKSAITKYGDSLGGLIAGLSIGSEDLYRISPTGIAAKSYAGANPDVLVSYIGQVRAALQGTPLSGVSIGHVDTWTAWVNGSNSAVIDACDWVGIDAYPYFQNTMANGIEAGAGLFNDAFGATVAVAKGKPVWITETGWPVSGPTQNLAVPSPDNAKTYWQQVGCAYFGKVNTWWYTFQDAFPTTPAPSFGIVGTTLSNTPLYDLSCPAAGSPGATTKPTTAAGATGASSNAPPAASGTAPAVSAGGGLSPSQNAGNGVPSSILSQGSAAPTGGAATTGTNGGSVNGTVNGTLTGTRTPASTPSGTASPTPSANTAPSGRGSVLGAFVSLMAVVLFL